MRDESNKSWGKRRVEIADWQTDRGTLACTQRHMISIDRQLYMRPETRETNSWKKGSRPSLAATQYSYGPRVVQLSCPRPPVFLVSCSSDVFVETRQNRPNQVGLAPHHHSHAPLTSRYTGLQPIHSSGQSIQSHPLCDSLQSLAHIWV